jgi:hypothetical protein
MFTAFCLSLLGLCITSIVAFIVAFKRRSKFLVVFVPVIAICGSLIYTSYMSVLGYPAEMRWEELPDKITVIYFRIEKKELITLWLYEDGDTRLIELPYKEAAEDGLEAQRRVMGRGYPVKYKRLAKGQGNKKPGRNSVTEDGRGTNSEGRNGRRLRGSGGWQYRVESYGLPIPGGSLPPK